MRVSNDFQRYEAERQIYSVLVMHFQEGITQAEIAKLTNLSHAKVNRLIKQGRELGMVEISIRSQYQALFDLEAASRRRPASRRCGSRRPHRPTRRRSCSRSAPPPPTCCSRLVQDGDTVCITGGKGVSAVVAALGSGPQLRGRGRAGHRLRAGQALYRRQSRRDPDGRAARRPGLPDPRAALRRQRRREGHADGHEGGHRRLRPRAPRPGRGPRHRLDPVGRLELLRPASGHARRRRRHREGRRGGRAARASHRPRTAGSATTS